MKINFIEQLFCPACGKEFIINHGTEILGKLEKYFTVRCPDCKHVIAVYPENMEKDVK